jgi:hypothetical protein
VGDLTVAHEEVANKLLGPTALITSQIEVGLLEGEAAGAVVEVVVVVVVVAMLPTVATAVAPGVMTIAHKKTQEATAITNKVLRKIRIIRMAVMPLVCLSMAVLTHQAAMIKDSGIMKVRLKYYVAIL